MNRMTVECMWTVIAVLAHPAGDRPSDRDVRGHVEPEPAVGLRDGAGQEALAPEVAPALDRVGAGGVVLARPRRDPFLRQALGERDHRLLNLAHRCTPRAVNVP